jgi:hypothetical protein
LKIKLKGRHFDTIEVIEAQSQAVLNTLTEHDFQDAFKKMAQWINACAWKGTTLRVIVANRHKVIFLPDGSTNSRNCGWMFVHPAPQNTTVKRRKQTT